jgi:hypothetical protein
MARFFESIAGLKTCLSFVLAVLALAAVWSLGMKGVAVAGEIPMILMAYIGGRSFVQASAHFAASKDPNCDTAKVIEKVNEK